jgi:hypothetical protein
MNDIGSGKIMARELQDIWMAMDKKRHLHPEIAYRIEKLVHRIAPLADKVFLKTEKARLLLVECKGKTVALQNQIESGGNDTFYVLTTLEKTFEYLLIKTYEFRIKAG